MKGLHQSSIVVSEVRALISALRQDSKWSMGFQYVDDNDEDDVIFRLLIQLKDNARQWVDWPSVDCSLFCHPFLLVLSCKKADNQVASAALTALTRFLQLSFISPSSPQAAETLTSIVQAVTDFKDRLSDRLDQEALAVKVLQLLLLCVKYDAGLLLSDESICSVVNACFSVANEQRSRNDGLHALALTTVADIISHVFGRLKADNSAAGEAEGRRAGQRELTRERREESVANARDMTTGETVNGASQQPLLAPAASGADVGDQVASSNGRPETEADETEQLEETRRQNSTDHKIEGGQEGQLFAAKEEAKVGMVKPYGVESIAEVLSFLCNLIASHDNAAWDEQQPAATDGAVIALKLILIGLEAADVAVVQHPEILALIQQELFPRLLLLGSTASLPAFTVVCNMAMLLFRTARAYLKLPLEAFFSTVLMRVALGRNGESFLRQELALEMLLDFCSLPEFASELFANYDCDISCSNLLEELTSLLSKASFPSNVPISSFNLLALRSLLAVLDSLSHRCDASLPSSSASFNSQQQQQQQQVCEFQLRPFWTVDAPLHDAAAFSSFAKQQLFVKRKLFVAAEHFNREPKKGLMFLQSNAILPSELDAVSVAQFFRHAPGLSKELVGDYLGEPDEFNVAVLHEFTNLFDFAHLKMDSALRLYLESFRLPGEAQKIGRVLEAFAERFFQQSPGSLANKDTAYILAYSMIMLNTDQHNEQVKKKMTEEEFIRNNRKINDGKDLPREMLSDLFHSIARNEIRISSSSRNSSSLSNWAPSQWLLLLQRSSDCVPYFQMPPLPSPSAASPPSAVAAESKAQHAAFDREILAAMAPPSLAALSVVMEQAEEEQAMEECKRGFDLMALVAASQRRGPIIDDIIICLARFTAALNPLASHKEPAVIFADSRKARMAAVALFGIANKYGSLIHGSWRHVLDCLLRLQKLGVLPPNLMGITREMAASDEVGQQQQLQQQSEEKAADAAASDSIIFSPTNGRKKKSSSLFASWVGLGLDSEQQPMSEEQVAAQQVTQQTIEECSILSIFSNSHALPQEPLMELGKAIVWAAGRPGKAGGVGSQEEEDTAVFCLDMLLRFTLSNRDRLLLVWPLVFDYLAAIVQTAFSATILVERAVFGLLGLCRKLLPNSEAASDELLRSMQIILKLDAKLADAFCERITRKVLLLVKDNAGSMRSAVGWRTTCSLLAITARHPEAADIGFEALSFVMLEGRHVVFVNFVPCLEAARDFAEARAGGEERSKAAVLLLAGLVDCLQQWAVLLDARLAALQAQATAAEAEAVSEQHAVRQEEDEVLLRLIGTERLDRETLFRRRQGLVDLWHRLSQALRRVCSDQREEVRNQAVAVLQRSLLAAEALKVPTTVWGTCFDQVVFVLLDDTVEIATREKPKEFRGMEVTMHLVMKLVSRVFLQFLPQLASLPEATFRALWSGVLIRMETFVKAKLKVKSEQLQESISELLKNILMVMTTNGILVEDSPLEDDGLWSVTWRHVKVIAPSISPQDICTQATEGKEKSSLGT